MIPQFEWPGPPILESQVADLERDVGSSLPGSYRRFLLSHNGGRPVHDTVDVPGLADSPTNLHVFFGIDRPFEASCIDWNRDLYAERLPIGLLPIARDSFGSLFCVSLRTHDHGSILFCDTLAVWGQDDVAVVPCYVVARDFDAFLAALRP